MNNSHAMQITGDAREREYDNYQDSLSEQQEEDAGISDEDYEDINDFDERWCY